MISEHTKMINCFIGFTKSDKKFSTILREIGYQVDSIESNFRNREGERVSPDLILSSRKINHTLLIDCKDGGINEEQLKKYSKIDKEDFIEIVSITEPDKIKFDLTLVCSSNSSSKIKKSTLKIEHPVLMQDNTYIYLAKEHGRFKVIELNNLFGKRCDVLRNIPVNYYPFGPNDDTIYISKFILISVVHLAMDKKRISFNQDDILRDSHPLWDKFDATHQRKMREKLNNIMTSKTFSRLNNFIKRTKGGEYKVNTKTYQSLGESCKKVMEELENMSKQTNISLRILRKNI